MNARAFLDIEAELYPDFPWIDQLPFEQTVTSSSPPANRACKPRPEPGLVATLRRTG